jgi:ankyrin repeat protein
VNAVTRDGRTAIREAALIGATELVRVLLNRSANLELSATEFQDTPLICAAEKGHIAVVELLLGAGADPNAQQSGGWSAIHYALLKRNEDMASIILEHSPNLNLSTITGVRPLHLAAMHGLTATTCSLLDRGAEIDATDNSGLTALWVAVQAGKLETVKTLVSRGARTDVVDRVQGHSLLDVAKMAGHTYVYLWLNQHEGGRRAVCASDGDKEEGAGVMGISGTLSTNR